MYRIKSAIALLRSRAYALITDKEIRSQGKTVDNGFDEMLKLQAMKAFKQNLDDYVVKYEEDISKRK